MKENGGGSEERRIRGFGANWSERRRLMRGKRIEKEGIRESEEKNEKRVCNSWLLKELSVENDYNMMCLIRA